MANSADPDQTVPFRSSLIRVCTVCSALSVPILRVFMVFPKYLPQNFFHFKLHQSAYFLCQVTGSQFLAVFCWFCWSTCPGWEPVIVQWPPQMTKRLRTELPSHSYLSIHRPYLQRNKLLNLRSTDKVDILFVVP